MKAWTIELIRKNWSKFHTVFEMIAQLFKSEALKEEFEKILSLDSNENTNNSSKSKDMVKKKIARLFF